MKAAILLVLTAVVCLAYAEETGSVVDKEYPCNDATCRAFCIGKGLPDGSCRSGGCWCSTKDIISALARQTTQNCNHITCIRACRSIDWTDGICKNDKCGCWKEDQPDEIEPISRLMFSLSATYPKRCYDDRCSVQCHSYGKNHGGCKENLCVCWD